MRTLLGFPYPEVAGLAPLWAAGVAREGKDEKTTPTVAVLCILTAGREGKMEILDKLYTEGRCGGQATEFAHAW
jgi:hypothetical protein